MSAEFNLEFDEPMTPEQFALATKGLRQTLRMRDIACRLLVNQESRQSVMEDTGITQQDISKLLGRVHANLEKQLKAAGLVRREVFVSEAAADVIAILEDEQLNRHLPRKK